eukprot:TRINITY_DN2597_c0_g1_i1.p1 TRINITY_DN2597_c0_g1~~TRINITY_DN2597_c0_g1_i1.p1  ORF type:complete len:430 (+),score=122.81 TRINITY_DN2597_c0_g1_i1:60-1292(+)
MSAPPPPPPPASTTAPTTTTSAASSPPAAAAAPAELSLKQRLAKFQSYIDHNKDADKRIEAKKRFHLNSVRAMKFRRKQDQQWYKNKPESGEYFYYLNGPDIVLPGSNVTFTLTVCRNDPGIAGRMTIEGGDDKADLDASPFQMEVFVRSLGSEVDEVKGKISRVDVGTYSCRFTAPKKEGTWFVNVRVNDLRLFRDNQVGFVAATPAGHIPGPIHFSLMGQKDSLKEYNQFEIVIHVKTSDGKMLDVPLFNFSAELDLPNGERIPVDVDFYAEVGTYCVTYTPQSLGDYQLHLYYTKQLVTSTTLRVQEGIVCEETRAVNAMTELVVGQEGLLMIEPRTRDGEMSEIGGDQFTFQTENSAGVDINAYEAQQGKYLVRYTFYGAGPQSISIFLRGEHISNSPVKIQVSDA